MKKSSAKSFRPSLEALEDRKLLSATLYGDTLTIESTNNADNVIVRLEQVTLLRKAGFTTFANRIVVIENGVASRFDASKVRLIEFYGKGGNDYFRNDTAIRAYAEGGDGRDTLIGGSATDEFFGGKDNDFLSGRGGVDYLMGEAGNDRLDGGKDGLQDEVYGGLGADTFVAEAYGISILSRKNRDTPLDFNAQEGDSIDWRLSATRR